MSRIPKPMTYKRVHCPTVEENEDSPSKIGRFEAPSRVIPPATEATVVPPRKVGVVVSQAKPIKGGILSAPNTAKRQPRGGKAPVQHGRISRHEVPPNPPPTRMKELNKAKCERKAELDQLEYNLQEETEAREALKAQVASLSCEKSSIKAAHDVLKIRLDTLECELANLNTSLTTAHRELLAKNGENQELLASIEKHNLDLKLLKDRNSDLERDLEAERRKNSDLTTTMVEMRDQLNVLQAEKSLSDRKNANLQSDLEDWKSKFAKLEQQLAEAHGKIQESEIVRRRLHNSVMELKGNVRVFCRMRPLLSTEIGTADESGTPDFVTFPDSESRQIELLKPASGLPADLLNSTILPKGKQKVTFTFDCVFPPNCTQTDVFREIEPLVQSALDGYNVCVFAYGQTGSGKTYTMEGPTDDSSCPGMIVLAMRQIFQYAKELQDVGWKHEMHASFLEIYNETINDLLTERSTSEGSLEIKLATGQSSSSLRDSQQHDVTVPGLTVVTVNDVEEVCNLINTAKKHRAVAATKCNDHSSRSHSVFSLKVKCKNQKDSLGYEGSLNFVDLAGSERLKESGSEGARLEETKFINKSLSNLGQVFMALSRKEKHIPYRNSRLTYLLQNCLGGNCKTLMFVNISPREEHFGETVNSLRFATAVHQCHIGVATRKTL